MYGDCYEMRVVYSYRSGRTYFSSFLQCRLSIQIFFWCELPGFGGCECLPFLKKALIELDVTRQQKNTLEDLNSNVSFQKYNNNNDPVTQDYPQTTMRALS